MADIVNEFEVRLVTYNDVREAHPNWSESAIEDYMARLRDVIKLADQSNTIENTIVDNSQNAMLFELNARVGSGDPLTSDETGFTVDSSNLSVDMIEA